MTGPEAWAEVATFLVRHRHLVGGIGGMLAICSTEFGRTGAGCTCCAYRKDAYCTNVNVPCATMGHYCGALTPKE